MSGGQDIVWEEPPPAFRSKYARLADQLRSRPGAWARVLGPATESQVESLRVTLIRGNDSIKRGEFKAKRAKREDGHYLWAVYVGNGENPA